MAKLRTVRYPRGSGVRGSRSVVSLAGLAASSKISGTGSTCGAGNDGNSHRGRVRDGAHIPRLAVPRGWETVSSTRSTLRCPS